MSRRYSRSKRRRPTATSIRRIVKDELTKEDLVTLMKFYTPVIVTASTTTGTDDPNYTKLGLLLIETQEKSKIAIGSQSSAIGNRAGRNITLRSLAMTFHVYNTIKSISGGAAAATAMLRIIIIKYAGSTVPTLLQIQNNVQLPEVSTAIHPFVASFMGRSDGDADLLNRYKVVLDTKVTLAEGLSENICRKISLRVKGTRIAYESGSGSANSTGNFYLWVIQDPASVGPTAPVVNPAPVLTFSQKTRYSI